MGCSHGGDPQEARQGFTTIDVSNFHEQVNPRESAIVLRTAKGQTIEWGRAPNRRSFGEVSVVEKIRTIERRLVDSECPAGARLNVRFPGGGVIFENSNL